MIVSFAEVSGLLGITIRIIGMRACATCRIIPEFHHLSHGSGNAAGINVAAMTQFVFRALAVVGVILVPYRLTQRANHSAGLTTTVEAASLGNRAPFSNDIGCRRHIVFTNILNLLTEAIQCKLEAFSHILRVKRALGGIGQDWLHPIVTGDDHKTTSFIIKYVIVHFATVGRDLHQVKADPGTMLAKSRST